MTVDDLKQEAFDSLTSFPFVRRVEVIDEDREEVLGNPVGGEEMGEVRVRIRLSNAGDEVLVRRGLLKREQVRFYEADALVDTGAVRCVLPPHVRERLGLAVVGRRVAEYADGRLEAVDLTEGITVEIMGRSTLEEAMVLGDEVMVGQTALEKLDLFADCQGQRLVPNPAHPDQPVSKVKYTSHGLR